jgi:polar amino acid transport system substrate-binding protein
MRGHRSVVWLASAVAIGLASSAGAADAGMRKKVTALVDQTAADIARDAPGTFEKIKQGVEPYQSKAEAELYTFVYDAEVSMVAHPKKDLVGRSFKGKPDVRGKKFRDELVEGALKGGSTWVEYAYQKPNESGIHPKSTYAKLVKGSDGKQYVVCAGMYLD